MQLLEQASTAIPKSVCFAKSEPQTQIPKGSQILLKLWG